MDLIIRISNNTIRWEDLVGKEHTEFGYKVIIDSYSKERKKITISEFHNDTPYSSEIVVLDADRCINTLSSFGFNINILEYFSYTKETLYKLKGFQQAGFVSITYNGVDFTADGMCELTFLTEDERNHLMKARNLSMDERNHLMQARTLSIDETPILISDIINGNI